MNQPKVKPEALSVQQAAVILSVSEGTIRNWGRLGVLKVIHLGPRLLRIPRDEIQRLRAARGV